jgi:pyruvate/2-oxoglutarate/acetoin dehydrogenase E1 component
VLATIEQPSLLLSLAGEDVGHYGGSYKVTYDLYKKYGDMRVLDTPICGKQTAAVAAGWRWQRQFSTSRRSLAWHLY